MYFNINEVCTDNKSLFKRESFIIFILRIWTLNHSLCFLLKWIHPQIIFEPACTYFFLTWKCTQIICTSVYIISYIKFGEKVMCFSQREYFMMKKWIIYYHNKERVCNINVIRKKAVLYISALQIITC